MKGTLQAFAVALLVVAVVHLECSEAKRSDEEFAQDLKDLINQPSRDGSSFGKYMSEPEKAAFERQRARELMALKAGCTSDRCEVLRDNDSFNPSIAHRRSLAALPPTAATCLDTHCPVHLTRCQSATSCSWWLDNCMDENDMPESCPNEAEEVRELLEPLNKCYFENCDPGSNSTSESAPVGFIQESTYDCMIRTCKSDYEFCLENPDCVAYISDCLETTESASEVCQRYRSSAWVAVKFLAYCYDDQCGGDGVQSERERVEDEANREWDEQNVCEDHPQNYYSCEHNIQCLQWDHEEDINEANYCSAEDTIVMCRDCAGPGEKCESAKICQDELMFCNVLDDEEKETLEPSHPCVHESCAVSRHSPECEGAVFEHCCNPELESCERTEPSTCSSIGCSRFTNPAYHEIDYEKAPCPFADVNGTCDHPSCNDPGMFREIVDLFVGGGNGNCWGPWCFQEVMIATCPAFSKGDTETNTTFSNRKLSDLMQRGQRLLHSSLEGGHFMPSLQKTQRLVLPSGWRQQLDHQDHEFESQLRGQGRRKLETVESDTSNSSEMDCIMQNCSEQYNTCLANEDCAYLVEHCTDEDDSKNAEDCQFRKTSSSLFEPLSGCYNEKCNLDPTLRCLHDACPAALNNCIDDEDCNYAIENCVDSDEAHNEEPDHNEGRRRGSLQSAIEEDGEEDWLGFTMKMGSEISMSMSMPVSPSTSPSYKSVNECEARMGDSTMELMLPLQECHDKMCNSDVVCVSEVCPDMINICIKDEDCNYFLYHCMGSSEFGTEECDTRLTDEVNEMMKSLSQCHSQHCSDDPILQCMSDKCENQMDACHQDTGCMFLLDNCMDDSTADPECKEQLDNNDTSTLAKSIQTCYSESCSHLDGHEEENEFQDVLDQASQCLEDEDGCAWANRDCENVDACRDPLVQVFQCESNQCAGTIIEQNFQIKEFNEVFNCIGRDCGIGGDDNDDDHPPSISIREKCAAVLISYCSDHPDEIACQSSCPYDCKQGICPCKNDACQAVYAAPLCARMSGPCNEYNEHLMQLYLSAGYYQPQDEWHRNRMAHFLFDPPPEDLNILANLPAEIVALGAACNALHDNLADNMAMCMEPSIEYCNMREWDQGCHTELSRCGDSITSWHESCDDGNDINGDGCSSFCYPDSVYICPDQGEPCEKCLRDERAEWGDENVCKFCSNDRVNTTSPCFASECQNIEDYEGAKSCDDHVEQFCLATLAAGLRDLGCDAYTKKSRMYTVPTVPNKCEYKIKSFNLNGKNINSVKLAIFTCKFADPHDTLEDTTPLFRYRHPYDSMSQEQEKALSANATAILDAMLETRQEKLIPLDQLRLDDFFPYTHPGLANEYGHPIVQFHDPLARLVIHHEEPEGNLNCHHSGGEHRDLYSLPATSEPLRMGLKAFLMKKRFHAMNSPYHSEEDDEFLHVNVSAIDAGELNPRLKSTAIFGIKLSTTWKSHGHSGHVEEREDMEWICQDWNLVNDWHDIGNNPNCTSVEDNIRNGMARIRFGQNLFQKGCVDADCDLRVDHCREVGLTPQRLEVSADGFRHTSEQVMSEVEKMTDADSWPSLVDKFIRVSAAASTQAYDDAMELFNRLVIRGRKPKFLKDVPDYCEHDYYVDHYLAIRNPAWEVDPCCNWELRRYQCCAPKDVPNGLLDVAIGVNRAQVSTYCPGYSAEVENLLQDVMVNIDQASSCAENLEASVSANVWDETWKVKDVCYSLIYDAESMECEKDDDCSHCSQSTCRIKDGSTSGICQVPWDDTEGCMLECLSKEMDPELVRYLREEWAVPATADEAIFREAFVDRMTEPACSGPRAWEPDIGRNGYEWECDTTCTANHLCDDWDYMDHLRQIARDEGHRDWIDFNNKEVCEKYNGTKNVWGQCEFESMATSPCKQESQCYEKCQKPHSAEGCTDLGGTWISRPGEDWGRCCPPDTYVFFDASRGEKICSYVPEGSPNGWELSSPACCEAENGSWKASNGYGQCCLGQWQQYTYDGETHSYCSTETWGWDMGSCYDECDALRKDCQTCRVDKMDCCGEVYKSANQTACESYMQCTDSSIWEGSGEICDDPKPFCAHCHGKNCWKAGESPSCFVNVEQYGCEAGLDGISTEWDADWHRCRTLAGSTNISGWDCFTAGPTVCPNPTDYPWYYNNDEIKPSTQWGERTCDRGCYAPVISDRETCEASSDHESGVYYYWDSTGANSNGVCKIYNVDNEADCAAIISAKWVPHSLSFNSGRFGTEEECNEGQCMGNMGWGGWSREQCESSGKHSCTRSCPECKTWDWPFTNQGYGACFSSNITTCANEGKPHTPCIISSLSESDCISTNELQVEWKSCSSYGAEMECNDNDRLDPYSQILGCGWHWGQCETQEACENAGDCDDYDNQRQQCYEPGWTHGDTCWASYLTESTDEETQQITSTYEYASCSDCRHSDGVCVAPRPDDRGCDDYTWHKLGCKVMGLYDEASCKASNSTNDWYMRAKTKEQCMEIKGCKEAGRHGISELPPDECVLCGGELQSLYEWHGGAWMKPQVQNLTWMSEGTRMSKINEWKPAIADYLLEKELALPIIKRFANKKQTQALLMFNIFTEALKTLACACGSGNHTDCFDWTEGSVSGVSKAFCGLQEPLTAACGTAVVNKTCLTEQDRGLRRLSETDTTGDSMRITWAHYSAGSYGQCFEPHSSADDRVLQNPLAVKNVNGVVIGQLLGDGKGMTSTGDFESVELCLDRRTDIREWDSFDMLDVGKLSDDGTTSTTIVPQYETKWIGGILSFCFVATSDGVYFPISRANASWIDLQGLDNTIACDTSSSITLFNATSGMLSCICRCGYSGETCHSGCLNNCSGSKNGQCLDGECSCSSTRTGADCGEFNCPIGLQGKRCSGQGLCKEDAMCQCEDNFIGDDCSIAKILPRVNKIIGTSFDDFQPPQASLTPSPTPLSSLLPGSMLSDQPYVSAEPSTTLSVKPSSEPSLQPLSSSLRHSMSSAPSGQPVILVQPPLPAPTPLPRPKALQPPPVPAPQSTCVEDRCDKKLQECLAVPAFDSCACYPGLLKCVSRMCPDDLEKARTSCETVASTSNVCDLECVPRPFPTANKAKIEMKVKAKMEISDVTVNDFMTNLIEPFKQAVTDPLPDSDPEDVLDVQAVTKGTSTVQGRKMMRKLAEDGINVDFSIKLENESQLVNTQNKLLDAVEGETDADGNQKPSAFAQAMEDRGVVSNATQLTVTQAKTEVIVVSAEDEEDFVVDDEEDEEQSFMKEYGAFVYAGAGGLVVLLCVSLFFACRSSSKNRTSPGIVVLNQ